MSDTKDNGFVWPVVPQKERKAFSAEPNEATMSAQDQSTALMLINSIVRKYGGEIDKLDLMTNEISILVPEEVEQQACMEIVEAMQSMGVPM